jgi:hypothetical protein
MTTQTKSKKRAILTADEFYKTASDSDLFKKVTLEIIEEEKKNPIDEASLRYARDWSILANQVVGAEQF